MKKALLVVSFGTSAAGAGGSIAAVEQSLRQAAPDRDFYRAFTSPTIRRLLSARGENVDSLPELLERLCGAGYEDVCVQPTHFLCGVEYDKLRETAAAYETRFSRLALGKPLLCGTRAVRDFADVLCAAFEGEQAALVLLGHGTEHYADLTYPAIQTAVRLAGRKNAYVGTVEGWPGFDEVLRQLKEHEERQVLLVPMMLVAGEHARSDMAGAEPDSWKSRLEAAGFSVRCHMSGMGLLPGVQALYRAHLREIL